MAKDWRGVPLGMHRMNPEYLDPDLTAAADVLLLEMGSGGSARRLILNAVIQWRGVSSHLAQPDQRPRINYCANRSSALKQRESSPISMGYSQFLLKIGTGNDSGGEPKKNNWSRRERRNATKVKAVTLVML